MSLIQSEQNAKISQAGFDMSLLSCPSDSNGIKNAPAAALGVYREPETGELQAGRWTFKYFTSNRKQASQCGNNWRMKHKTLTNIFDCSVQRNILTFWEICFFSLSCWELDWYQFHLLAFRRDIGQGYFQPKVPVAQHKKGRQEETASLQKRRKNMPLQQL